MAIDEAFAAGSGAKAFIRIFNPDYSFTDIAASVIGGGSFTLHASVPSSGVPIVQVGLETTGFTGDAGQLTATGLTLVDDAATGPGLDNRTGFNQVVMAVPGETVRYGVIAANNPADPIGPGAEGHLRLEFIDADGFLLEEASSVIVDALSTGQPTPFSFETVTPAGAAYTRLSIERVTIDPETDTGGSFVADAAFLQIPALTELPILTSAEVVFLQVPAVTEQAVQNSGSTGVQTVTAGESVKIETSVGSITSLNYQWYHNGVPVATTEDYAFTATPESGGTYFVVASNAAGPVIGAITQLTVLTPDADGDGISDYDESFVHGTDPALKDTDADGLTDYEEIFILRTDPLDPGSAFLITDFNVIGETVQVTFQSKDGVNYNLEGSADLATWHTIGNSIEASEDSTTVNENLPAMNPPLRFFRISAP